MIPISTRSIGIGTSYEVIANFTSINVLDHQGLSKLFFIMRLLFGLRPAPLCSAIPNEKSQMIGDILQRQPDAMQ